MIDFLKLRRPQKETHQIQVQPFKRDGEIKGLSWIPDMISVSYESYLIKEIDALPWNCSLRRRVQQYGYEYDYFSRRVKERIAPLPPFAVRLCEDLLEHKLISILPNQLIINEYKNGQGISKHIDSSEFDEVIFSISVGSPCTIIFRFKKDQQHSFELPARTFLKMENDARHKWTHEISPLEGNGKPVRRISLTFRNVKDAVLLRTT